MHSAKRALVHERVFDPGAKTLWRSAEKLVLGDPLDQKTDLGPVIDDDEAQRITEWIDEAVAGGPACSPAVKRTAV